MKPTDPRVLKQLASAKRPLCAVLASGVLSSVFVIAQAFALTAVIVAVVQHHSLAYPLVALGVVTLGRILSNVVGDVAAGRAAAVVGASMRRRVVAAVLNGRAGAMSEGEGASLATRGVTAAEPYLTRYIPTLVLAGVLPVLTVVVMATQDLLSAAIVVVTLPLIPVFGALVGLATRDRAESQWRAMASLSGHFVDVMKGLPTLVAFRRAEAQAGTIRTITNRYREATLKTLRIAFASSAVLELVATISVALVAVVVGVRLASGSLNLQTALVVLLLAPEAYWPLRRVGAEFHAAAEGVATFEKMANLPESADEPDQPTPADHRMLIGSDISFIYPGRASATLSHLDFVVPPACITAVSGPSGCGKSTLLALMAGLLEPSSGSVSVGDVRPDSTTWQGSVAWLPQRPLFLVDSVSANLRLGAPLASDEQMWNVLERVALAERVRSLGGLEAQVEEDAQNLSAGERARLALARVVLSKRPWVLLDEPTAHLDPITQQVLLDVIVELSASAAVVVVAHDPAVLAIADRVITLKRPVSSMPQKPVLTQPEPVAPDLRRTVEALPDAGKPGRARFVLSTFLGVLASFSGVALTATAGWLIVKASAHPATLTLLVAIVAVRTFGIGRPVFRYAERLRSHDVALKMLAEKRVAVYEAVVPLTPGRLGKRRGDVLTSIVDDVDSTLDRELRVKLPLRTYVAVLVASVAVCALLLPVASFAIGATSLLGSVTAYFLARVAPQRAEKLSVQARADLSATMVDASRLAPELTMWQAHEVITSRVDRCSAILGRATRVLANSLTSARAAILLSSMMGVAAVAYFGSDALDSGSISAPSVALLLLAPVALADVALPVVEAGGLHGRVQAAQARLDAYNAMEPAVTEAPATVSPGQSTDLVLCDVSLGWNGVAVAEHLSVNVSEGFKLGVVGPSGSGKSTLASALIRFIDPVVGGIDLGGQGLADLPLEEVRKAVGLVDDDPHVFASTLAENIRLARPGSTNEQVVRALEGAQLGDWFRTLPDGLDTWLGDGHAQVSGGERARIGLARTLLLGQPILVLDEPVAHLDADTARELTEDLLGAAVGKTVVWITHSQIGLEKMDDILDLGGCAVASNLRKLHHA